MKLVGCCILFFSIFQFGLKKVERLKVSIALLFDIWYAVGEIGRQIALSQSPLPEIYATLAKSGQGKTSFLHRLQAEGDFYRAYSEVKAQLLSQKSIQHTMDKFFRVLGKTEAQAQCENCRETASKLQQSLESEQSYFAQKRKMYLTVAACIGGMVVLFML